MSEKFKGEHESTEQATIWHVLDKKVGQEPQDPHSKLLECGSCGINVIGRVEHLPGLCDKCGLAASEATLEGKLEFDHVHQFLETKAEDLLTLAHLFDEVGASEAADTIRKASAAVNAAHEAALNFMEKRTVEQRVPISK